MSVSEKIERYYEEEHPFKDGIAILRSLTKRTVAEENFKWNFPVYTLQGKNVFGICKFKNHFGVWFFNGALLTDPLHILQNAQEGKTKAMRHWKFQNSTDIDSKHVLAYLNEAIENQKQGIEVKVSKKSDLVIIPELLQELLNSNSSLYENFKGFSPYKQKEFCEYISEAKQEVTKKKRLEKIRPMIEQGVGLNDKYR